MTRWWPLPLIMLAVVPSVINIVALTNKLPRTLSSDEEYWVASCIERLYMNDGLDRAKHTCFRMADGLYQVGYFQ
jgi:hypothetical protein